MLQQINDWWLGLESREQTLLKVMVGFLVLFLAYSLVWKPIQTTKLNAEAKLASAKNEWNWLNEQVPLIQQSYMGGAPQKNSNIDSQNELIRVLQASLRKQNLFNQMKKVQGAGSDGARVSFDSVVSSRLMKWLSSLEQKGLVASKLEMTSVGVDAVKAKIEFELPK